MQTGISFGEAFRYWLRLGFVSFGGPTGQIAMMHKDLVEEKKWIDEDHFLQALNFCMLLPGPEAQQLAIYIGWLLHRTWGGIVAGVFFVLPSVFILWGLSWLYVSFGDVPAISAFFYGLKPAVAAIVADAVIRIGRKSLRNVVLVSIAAISFIGIYFLKLPFPAIVFSAGLIGYLGSRFSPETFFRANTANNHGHTNVALSDEVLERNRINPTWQRSLKVIAISLIFWFLPVILLGFQRGWDDIFIEIGVLYSKATVVTFGGAYAVLSYIGQQAVDHYHWLTPEQMIDGLGLAETTPGPLIMVGQFIGYIAAYSHAKGLDPATSGAVGGLLTTWVTFTPCFLWIFLGAPYIERLRNNIKLGSALSAITAAIVGVVLNLSVIFTYHVLLPEGKGFDWYALTVSIIAFIGMTRLRWGMIPVIVSSALAGFLWKMVI